MLNLHKSTANLINTKEISSQVRKALRVLFPDSNAAGDYDIVVRHSGLLLIPRIGGSVAINSDFYFKILAVLEVALWPTVQLQHPLAMLLQSLPSREWNRSRAFYYPWLIGASKRLVTTEKEEITYTEKTGQFKLMSNISIPLGQHMIVSGQTGSGKSYLLRQLLAVFNKLGSVILVDPKLSDAARWSRGKNVELIKPRLDSESTGSSIGSDLLDAVNERLNRLEATMYNRQNQLYQQSEISSNYRLLNVKPIFLVIDELASLTIGANRQAKADFFDHLTRLSLLARESGIVIVLALQQARSESIPTSIRAQMGVKILLGPIDKDNSTFLFPSLDTVPFLPIAGYGTGIMSIAGSNKYLGVLPIATPTLLGKDGNQNG